MAIKIGIIGGSGMDDPNLMGNIKTKTMTTPYGKPSSALTIGKVNGVETVVLARHGKKHSIYPTGVNYRANIFALKKAGCTHIIATTACGSLKESIKPGDLVFLDQFIDFTKHRPLTYHDKKVVHVGMADPFCSGLRELMIKTAQSLNLSYHPRGTVVTIEGPRFSTRAESHMFRMLGADVINMSSVPEVALAKELGIHYQAVAMSTDYDCWKQDEEPVTWEMIQKTMNQNADNVKRLIIEAIPNVKDAACSCNAAGH